MCNFYSAGNSCGCNRFSDCFLDCCQCNNRSNTCCQQCVEHEENPVDTGCCQVFCQDSNGGSGYYCRENRNPFWPEFSHPTSLCCRELYSNQ